MYPGRAFCTYAQEWTGAADGVQVHLTHGLVVEQGDPEETHGKAHSSSSSGSSSLAYIDS